MERPAREGVTPHLALAINLNNVTDRRYYQTAGTSASGNWYGLPRNYALGVRGSF